MRRGLVVDALEDIDQVVVGVDVVRSASDDETVQRGRRLGTDFAPAEQPVLPIHGDRAQRTLQVVGVDGDLGVAKVDA